MPEPREGIPLQESLRPLVGVFTATQDAREEVNAVMIRHWCDAMSDRNPVYVDAAVAARSIHGGIVAPPAMLDTWVMPGLGPRTAQLTETGEPAGLIPVMERLDAAGFTSIVATNTTHEYERYLRLGERLRVRHGVTEVSPEKATALGVGHFVSSETEFTDQHGERVGRMAFRIFKFKPAARAPAPADPAGGIAKPRRPRPAISRDTRFFWDGIERGELRIQRCNRCGALYHPPRVRCTACGAYDMGHVVSKGRGTVYSFVEVHHPQFPMFEYPLIGVLVQLDEGTRILSNLVGVEPDRVTVGMPVELVIEAVDPELELPLFRPAGIAPSSAMGRREESVGKKTGSSPPQFVRRDVTVGFEEVRVGDLLATCAIPITPTLVVSGALASRDFEVVHHDVESAKKRGAPNIFMNIMTTGGLATRYVTDWAGPEALVRSMKIRLGVPNFPGDTMTFSGDVEATERRDRGGIVRVAVRGTNGIGEHVSGILEVELPLTARAIP